VKDRILRTSSASRGCKCVEGSMRVLFILMLCSIVVLSACGGNSSNSSDPPQAASMVGNWQFSMTNPDTSGNYPTTSQYGLQGGFLLQSNGSLTGQAIYSISGPAQGDAVYQICDTGSAQITGSISGQTVNLVAVAGTQTFTLQGTLGSDGSITSATFTTPGGTATGFQNCGVATPTGGLSWSATLVPSLTGAFTGTFHSSPSSANSGPAMLNQSFPVTGSLTQGKNIGASSATITGTLSFLDPVTNLSDYPCVPSGTIYVNGQISGDTVLLQLIGIDGSTIGQIGVPPSQVNYQGDNLQSVTFQPSAPNGPYVIESTGIGYVLSGCSGHSQGDQGYVCLGLNSSTPCQQPITVTPAFLSFAPQLLVPCATPDCSSVIQGTPATQSVTLINTSGAALNGVTLDLTNGLGSSLTSDFSGINNYMESDNCGALLTSWGAGQSCTVTIAFVPQQGCIWQPTNDGATFTAPQQCPDSRSANVTVTLPPETNNNNELAIPITGTGLSYLQPSTRELDFGAEGLGQTSVPQLVTLTNQGPNPVQVFGSRNVPCPSFQGAGNTLSTLTLPLTITDYQNRAYAGLQVVQNGGLAVEASGGAVQYYCDIDDDFAAPHTNLANFQISSDTCTGATIAPQGSCGFQVTFAPQPNEYGPVHPSALDYFLQLNTLTCAATQTTDCEIDSGRFPVELQANAPSPLRMLPAAGMDFGLVTVGSTSVAQTITLFNDPTDPAFPGSPSLNLLGKITASGSYSESDDCPSVLTPGSTCTLTVSFRPKSTGFNGGQLKIAYTISTTGIVGNTQVIYLRGRGQ